MILAFFTLSAVRIACKDDGRASSNWVFNTRVVATCYIKFPSYILRAI